MYKNKDRVLIRLAPKTIERVKNKIRVSMVPGTWDKMERGAGRCGWRLAFLDAA
jgi:hypothetical protein